MVQMTTASIDNDGVVKYVNTSAITAGTDGTVTVVPTTDVMAATSNKRS